jgi:oxygen-independent coproporphyrinogen-3 oxidase
LAGIYLHIPFCRQACHYCNFHFSTSLRNRDALLQAIATEVELQKDFLEGAPIDTIYFGGGTPSLLTGNELEMLLTRLHRHFIIQEHAELTLEANPDDLTEVALSDWQALGINRLSIGVQSFFEEDLRWMNRAHSAEQSWKGLEAARRHFDNITIDLLYGTPGLSDPKWRSNVMQAIALDIRHLSCYALTVEPQTPLDKLIRLSKKEAIDPDQQAGQFLLLMEWLEAAGYIHYEISNFAKPGYISRHNASYWSGTPYLGLGPSAHSFNGRMRQWNVSNNSRYIEAIKRGSPDIGNEVLTPDQQLNEYIMTSLRTAEGLQLERTGAAANAILQAAGTYLNSGHLTEKQGVLRLTREGKLLADGIAATLFR